MEQERNGQPRFFENPLAGEAFRVRCADRYAQLGQDDLLFMRVRHSGPIWRDKEKTTPESIYEHGLYGVDRRLAGGGGTNCVVPLAVLASEAKQSRRGGTNCFAPLAVIASEAKQSRI